MSPAPSPLAQAWSLKDQCYALLNTTPQQAAQVAEALGQLARAHPEPEIEALALWTGGAAAITRGQMAEAAERLALAGAAFAALGQAGPAAQTQVPRVIALSQLGRFDEASACAQQALAAFKAQGDRAAAGRMSLNLGSLLMSRDACTEALQPYREAAVLFARVGDHEHSVMADIGLADALAATGDGAEAQRIYARARMRAQRHGLAVPQALVDESTALLALARGRYREALAGLEAARRRYEALGMPQHQVVAEKQLADTYLALRLLPEADALYRQVQAELTAQDMAPELANTLAQRGRLSGLLGREAEAAQCLADAAQLFAEQDNPVGAAQVALARADAAWRQATPEALAQAGGLAAQVEAVAEGAGRPELRARARLMRARCRLQQGEVDAAAQDFEQVLAWAAAGQGLDAQVQALTGRAQVAQRRGQQAAAEAACEAAIGLFEAQRAALPGAELRAAFLGQHLLPYQVRLRLALSAHAAEPGPRAAAEVLRQLDRMRARTLGEQGPAPATAPEPELDALRTRLHWLYRRTQGLDDEEPPSPALLAERQQLEATLLERQRRARLAADTAPEEHASEGPLDPATLQAALGPQQALVAYGVADGQLLAVVLRAEGARLLPALAPWTEVLAAVQAARFQIDSLRSAAPALRAHAEQLQTRALRRLQALHRLIWAPLQDALGGVRQVLLMPHGALASLPFAALHDGEQPLATQLTLAGVPSLRMAWRGLQRPPRAPQRLLALGESSRLPQAGPEAQAVAALYPQAVLALGPEATLTRLQAEAPEADMVHLACHALFRADNPMFSALHLSDAALTVEQVERWQLPASTVVLGACETGLAGADQADEGFGLVRAFLAAGASRVLASLWPVDDAVTAGFMRHFHTAVRAGATPAAALAEAQVGTMRHHPHPFHWAAFALHGGW